MEIAAHGVYSLLASPKVFGVLIIWPVQIVNVKGRSGCLLANNLTTVVSSIAGMSSLTEFDSAYGWDRLHFKTEPGFYHKWRATRAV